MPVVIEVMDPLLHIENKMRSVLHIEIGRQSGALAIVKAEASLNNSPNEAPFLERELERCCNISFPRHWR